jgi:hypothetical protein
MIDEPIQEDRNKQTTGKKNKAVDDSDYLPMSIISRQRLVRNREPYDSMKP